MGILYHGSKEHGLKTIEPRQSTHGTYVYATPYKVLALHFGKRCGDDLTYALGNYSDNNTWNIVELIPGAFEKMYSSGSSIYSLSDETFKDINTGFSEVVSEVPVDVQSEEIYDNVFDGLKKTEEEGLVRIYRYPNKPDNFNNNHLIEQRRYYITELHREFDKNNNDRFIYLHPELLDEFNNLLKEYNYDYSYKAEDLIDIFKNRCKRQLYDLTHEQYVDCAYISICNTFPSIKQEIDKIYEDYKNSI